MTRRQLLAGAGAVLAAELDATSGPALAAGHRLVLAPARRADGTFAVMILDDAGKLLRDIALPARGHDLAVHPESGRAIAFARRPGGFAVAFDLDGRAEPTLIAAQAGRHFFGHGVYARDGRRLFATENDYETGQGVIGVYDATNRYRRIGEFPTHGIGTHEVILLADGRTLAIANGGIETHPAYGREMLNIPTMDPSLAFVDMETGDLLAQHRLPASHHKLSIRHMAVGGDGAIWFGTQWEGDPLETPSLVGRATLDGGLRLAETPAAERDAMRRYVGAVAASRDGTMICASAPRGGRIAYWSAATGRYLGHTDIADASGVAGSGANRFMVANGEGLVCEAEAAGTRIVSAQPGLAFDNHLRIA